MWESWKLTPTCCKFSELSESNSHWGVVSRPYFSWVQSTVTVVQLTAARKTGFTSNIFFFSVVLKSFGSIQSAASLILKLWCFAVVWFWSSLSISLVEKHFRAWNVSVWEQISGSRECSQGCTGCTGALTPLVSLSPRVQTRPEPSLSSDLPFSDLTPLLGQWQLNQWRCTVKIQGASLEWDGGRAAAAQGWDSPEQAGIPGCCRGRAERIFSRCT